MEIIKKIQIRKFRSIKSLTNDLSPSSLNVFVGQNDQGKSNVLRALNLFFNGNTDVGHPYRFDDDYCFHANTGTGTRREIRIDLIIHPPKHRFKHSNPVRWMKTWKRDGSVTERKINYITNEDIHATNNVSKWLDKIRYRYVPAIRGPDYFALLMGELHDVLSESHEEVLKDQGDDFIQGIRSVTEEITEELNAQIGIPSAIQVPSDFKLLFSNLDFGSKKDNNIYHLKQRGDGIKVRHIPVVLNYMAEQERSIAIPGFVKPDTIWGFEEPENNLELKYAFELAEKFKEYSKGIQIFLTTHSPAFYALDKTDSDGVNTYHVDQGADGCTTLRSVTHDDTDSLHEVMGFLPMITPYLSKIYEHQLELDTLRAELDSLATGIACVVLTEDTNYERLRTYFSINDFDIEQVEFISYNGSQNINEAIFLGDYLQKKDPDISVIVHRDRDYLTDDSVAALAAKAKAKDILFFVTDGVDIESHYLSASHINALYPKMSVEKAAELIEKATSLAEKKSKSRMIDQYFSEEKRGVTGAAKKIDILERNYIENKTRFRYGKSVCGHLVGLLQKELGVNANIYQESDYVYCDTLLGFSSEIWCED